MPRSIFTSHFEMLSMYEKPTKKAKFWTSYVRSLGGSEDIQARERKEQHKYADKDDLRSIYDNDSKTAHQRITTAGYHYTPLSRNTYGHTPRKTGQKSIHELSK